MAEELGKIEKPSVEEFKGGRKLYFVPLIYCGPEAPDGYVERFSNYWNQIEEQISSLETKLGKIHRIFHELITVSGEEGMKALKELNNRCGEVTEKRLAAGAEIELIEESELLAELMDWSRCLSVGFQSQKCFNRIYDYFREVNKSRNEYIARQIDEKLKADEIGIIFMREGHQVQFPADIDVFYVAPPALDELKRWLRAREEESPAEAKTKEDKEDKE